MGFLKVADTSRAGLCESVTSSYSFTTGLLKPLLASTKVLAKTFSCARGHYFKRALLCSPEDYCARTMTIEKERNNLLTNIIIIAKERGIHSDFCSLIVSLAPLLL